MEIVTGRFSSSQVDKSIHWSRFHYRLRLINYIHINLLCFVGRRHLRQYNLSIQWNLSAKRRSQESRMQL